MGRMEWKYRVISLALNYAAWIKDTATLITDFSNSRISFRLRKLQARVLRAV